MKRTIGAAVLAVVTLAGCTASGETPGAGPTTTVLVTVTAGPDQSEPAESSEAPEPEPTTEATTPTPEATTPSGSGDGLTVGDAFTTPRGGTLTLVSAERRPEGLGQFDAPPEAGVYLEVVIDAVTGPQGGTLNPFEFKIRDSAGSRYDPTFGETAEPGLGHAELAAGEQIRGSILFDVPDGPVDLLYVPALGSTVVEWTIP